MKYTIVNKSTQKVTEDKELDDFDIKDLKQNRPELVIIGPDGKVVTNVTADLPTPLESFGRGALQGATLGFADELDGGDAFLGNKIGQDWGIEGRDKTKSPYEGSRDRSREIDRAASEDNYGSYLAGELVGGILPEAAAASLGIAGPIGGALMGGIQGYGSSESEDFAGKLKDTAVGAGIGLATGGLVGPLSRLLPGALKKGKLLPIIENFVPNDVKELARKAPWFNKSAIEKLGEASATKSAADAAVDAAKNLATQKKSVLNDVIGLRKARNAGSISSGAFDARYKELMGKLKELGLEPKLALDKAERINSDYFDRSLMEVEEALQKELSGGLEAAAKTAGRESQAAKRLLDAEKYTTSLANVTGRAATGETSTKTTPRAMARNPTIESEEVQRSMNRAGIDENKINQLTYKHKPVPPSGEHEPEVLDDVIANLELDETEVPRTPATIATPANTQARIKKLEEQMDSGQLSDDEYDLALSEWESLQGK